MGKQNKEAAITCKNGCVKAGLRPCKFVAKAVMELLPGRNGRPLKSRGEFHLQAVGG